MKKIIICLLIMSLLLITSCSKKQPNINYIKNRLVLNVATNADFAPFEYIENNEFCGIDIDIIKEYAKYLGVTCNIKNMDFKSALNALTYNNVDLTIAAISVNPERTSHISFSNTYYQINLMVMVKEDSNLNNCNSKDELLQTISNNNTNIGVLTATTSEMFVQGNEDFGYNGIKNTTCFSYNNLEEAWVELDNNTIDCIITDSVPARNLQKEHNNLNILPYALTYEQYAIAVPKGHDDVIESLNEFIQKIKDDGTLDKIISKYYK